MTGITLNHPFSSMVGVHPEVGLQKKSTKASQVSVSGPAFRAAVKWSLPPPALPQLSSLPFSTRTTSTPSRRAAIAAPLPAAPAPRISTSVSTIFPRAVSVMFISTGLPQYAINTGVLVIASGQKWFPVNMPDTLRSRACPFTSCSEAPPGCAAASPGVRADARAYPRWPESCFP